ncbi:MAG: rod shape-determining protein [Pirellulaceae bacterium]
MTEQAFFVGMDLGTFKTSVVSSSGNRDVVYTAVGWAKDHVARAMLGREVVFGEDVFEQRLALDVVRPFLKGALKYSDQAEAGLSEDSVAKHTEAARLIVEHAVSLVRPPFGAPIYGVIGAPSRASIESKKLIMEAARSAFDCVAIVPEPFTVAYGVGRLKDTLVVDIGAGTIDICPMFGTYPREQDQLTIPLGGDAVDERFYELMRTTFPDADLSLNMAREIKEKHGFVHNVNEKALATLRVHGKPTQVDVTEPLKEACRMIVDPIIEGIRELVARFDPEFQQSLLKCVLLGGGGSQLNGLDHLIEEALEPYGGSNVRKVHDSVYAGACGALKLAMGMPEEYWAQIRESAPDRMAAMTA